MTKKKDDLTPPKEDIFDKLNKVTEVAFSVGSLSVDPTFGLLSAGALALFKTIAPSYQKRLYNWMNDVVEKINELENKYDEFKAENLVNNELFLSAFQSSSRIAVQSHQKEKLDALRNALINTVIMKDIDENYKLLFITYIETITPFHMSLLKFYRTTRVGEVTDLEPYSNQVELFLSHSTDRVEVDDYMFTQICKDLELKGLLIKGRGDPSKESKTNRVMREELIITYDWIGITESGKQFLKFILEPNK